MHTKAKQINLKKLETYFTIKCNIHVIYKLASAVISNRLKKVLDNIINENQKGFIAGRFLGENVRLIYDVLFESKKQIYQVYYYLSILNRLSILFHGNFVMKVLDYFDFGNSIKSWVGLF